MKGLVLTRRGDRALRGIDDMSLVRLLDKEQVIMQPEAKRRKGV